MNEDGYVTWYHQLKIKLSLWAVHTVMGTLTPPGESE